MENITADYLEEKLRNSLQDPKIVQVVDLSDCGCGSKFDVFIVANEFENLPLLQQHRLVNKIIINERPHIHALTLKTKSPSSWEKEQIDSQINENNGDS
jgi:stress-induced morphogen